MRMTLDRHTATKVHIYFNDASSLLRSYLYTLFNMSPKRGRPLSGDSDSVAVNRRREQVRERMRRLRQRQQDLHTGTVTSVQQAQEERIVNLPTIEEHQAAETLLALGVRSSEELQLPQDPVDARLQQQANDVDEHDQLYADLDASDDDDENDRAPQLERSFFYQFTLPKRRRAEVDSSARSTHPFRPDIQSGIHKSSSRQSSVSQPCAVF